MFTDACMHTKQYFSTLVLVQLVRLKCTQFCFGVCFDSQSAYHKLLDNTALIVYVTVIKFKKILLAVLHSTTIKLGVSCG